MSEVSVFIGTYKGLSDEQKAFLRYQSEHLAKALWNLAKGNMGWQRPRSSEPYSDSFMVVEIPESVQLSVKPHYLRLWQKKFQRVYKGLSGDEEFWFKELMLSDEYTSVFYMRKGEKRMYLTAGTEVPVTQALIRVLEVCEIVKPAPVREP